MSFHVTLKKKSFYDRIPCPFLLELYSVLMGNVITQLRRTSLMTACLKKNILKKSSSTSLWRKRPYIDVDSTNHCGNCCEAGVFCGHFCCVCHPWTTLGISPGMLSGSFGTHHEDPGQAKVSHLADVVLAYQDVPGSQVAVNVVLQLQVCHTSCNLCCHLDLVGETQRGAFILWGRGRK